ncbi:DMT family transporter [Eubacterium sp. 1001713B170207_170306_E7]|uniref:DMT family transporter n=1 Tax=Eubacterium sp. 1001713B170207_170306_E7 TaxID=2787097 RepID=UPI001898537C|nr:DMT family transporter [Eubacterium sp. 1001713B170207_170306_E7]
MKKDHLIGYKQNIIRCNLGFRYALICGVCWGMAYILITSVMKAHQGDSYSMTMLPVVLATSTTFIVTLISGGWLVLRRKFREFVRTLHAPAVVGKLVLAAVMGGIAAFCTYILALSDTIFSTIAVLFYPVLTAVIARKWYKEIISWQCALGIGVILVCSGLVYLPNLFAESGGSLLLSLFGLAAGIGWGVEAAIVGKVCETADSDVCLCIRFCFESLLWLLICLALVFTGSPLLSSFQQYFQGQTMWMIPAIAVFLAVNYNNWYRSIVFIGACRGPAVSNLSGFILLVLSMVFYRNNPDWFTILSASGSLIGVVIIYMDCANSDGLPLLRQKGAVSVRWKRTRPGRRRPVEPPAKAAILERLEDTQKLWDYEIADYIEACEKDYTTEFRELVREWTVEMRVMGLIEIVQETIDSGEHFQRGKRLCQYRLAKTEG